MKLRLIAGISACILAYGFNACKTAKPAATTIPVPQATSATGNYILALTLRAFRVEGDSNIHFEVYEILKKEGKLKPSQGNTGEDFSISFATAGNAILSTSYIANPLDTWIESSEKAGQLQTTQLKKKEDFVSVRTNYKPGITKLIIKKNRSKDTSSIIIPVKEL